VVWGNAEEKVQIVNAFAKVRYGGGAEGGAQKTKKRRSSGQVTETRVNFFFEFPK
jgi:hypothetical protein